jgi:hypothetical protein
MTRRDQILKLSARVLALRVAIERIDAKQLAIVRRDPDLSPTLTILASTRPAKVALMRGVRASWLHNYAR